MAAFGINKDSKGITLSTHADTSNFANTDSPTVTNYYPHNRGPYKKQLNRAERRALKRNKK